MTRHIPTNGLRFASRVVLFVLLLCSVAAADQKMQFSFNSGELSPKLGGRVDLNKYFTGLETMENTIALQSGAAMRRPGFEYIATARYTETTAQLIPFQYNTEQNYILEFGDKYMRVFADGGQVWTPDSETSLLLHFDGVQGSTIITDSGNYDYTATAHGGMSLDTNDKVFGTASLYGATSDYVTVGDGDELAMSTGAFTIDWRQKFDFVSSGYIFSQRTDANNFIVARWVTNYIQFYCATSGVVQWNYNFEYTPTTGEWHHYALIRGWGGDNTVIALTVDGEAKATTTVSAGADWGNYTGEFYINAAYDGSSGVSLVRYDEFRVSKGVARWTSTFDPPSVQYPFYTKDDSGSPYTLATPYPVGSLADLRYCQSADTMYIAHEGYTPTKLTRTDHDAWTLSDITFDSTRWPPFQDINITTTTLTASATTGSITVTASAALFNTDSIGTFYQMAGGYFQITAYTSTTHVGATVLDDLTAATATASWYEGAWSVRRGWPRTVNFFEERLVFGGSPNQPMSLWMSASGDFENYSTQSGSTVADNDAVVFTISSDQVNAIRWTRPTKKLLIGTTGGEYWLSGQTSNEAVTPSSILVRRETQYGSQNVDAISIGEDTFFVQRPGKKVRGFAYKWQADSYVGDDLTLLADHLTRDYPVTKLTYQANPNSILWALRNDGYLLGLTYLKDQEVLGWHKHFTDGTFESIAVIPASAEDELWAVVKRTIGGVDYRYVERMATQFDGTIANAFFVDSGLTYNGTTAVSTISGYTHLEGERVQVLADGEYRGYTTVASNAIVLTPAATVVSVGLPYTSTIKTMRLAKGDGTWQGLTKKIQRVITRFYETCESQIGPDADNLDDYSFTDGTLFSGDKQIVSTKFRDGTDGQIMLRQVQPYPWTILGIIPQFSVTDR